MTPTSSIFIATSPVDFRKGINGLAAICRNEFSKDPMSGSYFVFRNKRRNSLKIIFYDGEGFWLFLKRLSRGTFPWWPTDEKQLNPIESKKLSVLIMSGNPQGAEFSNDWKKILR